MESRTHMQRRMDAVLSLKNNITASRVGPASPVYLTNWLPTPLGLALGSQNSSILGLWP